MKAGFKDLIGAGAVDSLKKVLSEASSFFAGATPVRIADHRNESGIPSEQLLRTYLKRQKIRLDQALPMNPGLEATISSFRAEKGKITSAYVDFGEKGLLYLWFNQEGKIVGCLR